MFAIDNKKRKVGNNMIGASRNSVLCLLLFNLYLGRCSVSSEGAGSKVSEGKYSFEGVCEEGHSAEFETTEGGCKFISENTVWSSPLLEPANYQTALRHCSELDNGWDDWRLPYTNELLEISGPDRGSSALSYLKKGYHWSKASGNSSQVVAVDLSEVHDNKTLLGLQEVAGVLCVREGYTAKEDEGCKKNSAEFWTSTGGCRHLATGLTWSKAMPMGVYSTNHDAENSCGELHQGGFRDWRPPMISEFLGLNSSTRIDVPLGDFEKSYFRSLDLNNRSNYFQISSGNSEIYVNGPIALICVRGNTKDFLVQK